MQKTTLPLDGLSSVRGKPVIPRFDGGMLSSDSGVLALGEIERRLRVSERLAACIVAGATRRGSSMASST